MRCRGYLLATVSSLAMIGAANAQPSARGPVVAAAYNWTGFYIGIHGGGAWLDHKQSTTINNGTCNTPSAVLDGELQPYSVWRNAWWFCRLQLAIGAHRLRRRSGRQLDRSKKSVTTQDTVGLGGPGVMTFTGRVDWLATARGRLGITMSPTLLYVTGGMAFGGVKSSWTDNDPPPAPRNDSLTVRKVKVGWVAGGGIEHAFANNWLVRVEGLFHDLGKVTGTYIDGANNYTTTFRHRVSTVRAGLALRW